jgi:hypothetical protein
MRGCKGLRLRVLQIYLKTRSFSWGLRRKFKVFMFLHRRKKTKQSFFMKLIFFSTTTGHIREKILRSEHRINTFTYIFFHVFWWRIEGFEKSASRSFSISEADRKIIFVWHYLFFSYWISQQLSY